MFRKKLTEWRHPQVCTCSASLPNSRSFFVRSPFSAPGTQTWRTREPVLPRQVLLRPRPHSLSRSKEPFSLPQPTPSPLLCRKV